MRRSYSTLLLCLGCLTPIAYVSAQAPRVDSLDAFVKAQMAQRHVRGLSLAIIKDGKIAVARGYGVTDDVSKAPVSTSTLFQAGSISKPVAALGALHLVEAGTLSLDADVNTKLTSWKVPDNRFTSTEKVTLRRLLSHSAGMTVHGFPGYDVSERVPTRGAGTRRHAARQHRSRSESIRPLARSGATLAAASPSCSKWWST